MFGRTMAVAVPAMLVFLAGSVQAVLGQEPKDIEQIEACLTAASEAVHGQPRECISKLSDACNIQEGAGSAAHCMSREADAWKAIGGQRLSDLVNKSKPEIADYVRSAQTSWEKFQAAHCDATGEFFSQYSGSAGSQWYAQCMRDTAAERALLLDDWLMRAEDFE